MLQWETQHCGDLKIEKNTELMEVYNTQSQPFITPRVGQPDKPELAALVFREAGCKGVYISFVDIYIYSWVDDGVAIGIRSRQYMPLSLQLTVPKVAWSAREVLLEKRASIS